MRLAGNIPDFGYISGSKRKLFFDFCINSGFITTHPIKIDANKKISMYIVLKAFRFAGMLDYRPKPIIFEEDCQVVIYPSFKMTNIRISYS